MLGPVYKRLLKLPLQQRESVFLFGPRGTGKTRWLKTYMPNNVYINLLKFSTYQKLAAHPDSLSDYIPPNYNDWIIIDEIQRVPELLNEIHEQIESHDRKFLLTGSSARGLRRKGVNLLAGRALSYHMHPLLIDEIGDAFNLDSTLERGLLPKAQLSENPEKYLDTYIKTYVREEVFQEALVRNMTTFSRFIEVASFSQGEMLNISNIASDVGTSRQTIMNYFDILDDLLIAIRIPVFSKRAKREVKTHPKFYYFDVGVYRTIRPSGYLDSPEEADGAGLETLFLQSVRAVNDYHNLKYEIFFWHTTTSLEVDFIVYGEKGLYAFEIKRSRSVNAKMLRGLTAFKQDYPDAKLYFVYTGNDHFYRGDIEILPMVTMLQSLTKVLAGNLS